MTTPGENICGNVRFLGQTATQHSALVDENYVVIGANGELSIQEKIKRGEYVDFVCLLPKDKAVFDDNWMELVNRGGQTFLFLQQTEIKMLAYPVSINGSRPFVFSQIFIPEHIQRERQN